MDVILQSWLWVLLQHHLLREVEILWPSKTRKTEIRFLEVSWCLWSLSQIELKQDSQFKIDKIEHPFRNTWFERDEEDIFDAWHGTNVSLFTSLIISLRQGVASSSPPLFYQNLYENMSHPKTGEKGKGDYFICDSKRIQVNSLLSK